MAVVTRYVVIRNEREEGVFATQQEADAYDAMLDRAEQLMELLEAEQESLGLSTDHIEAVARMLANRTDAMAAIFAPAKGGKRAKAVTTPKAKAKTSAGENPESADEPLAKVAGQN